MAGITFGFLIFKGWSITTHYAMLLPCNRCSLSSLAVNGGKKGRCGPVLNVFMKLYGTKKCLLLRRLPDIMWTGPWEKQKRCYIQGMCILHWIWGFKAHNGKQRSKICLWSNTQSFLLDLNLCQGEPRKCDKQHRSKLRSWGQMGLNRRTKQLQ